MNKIKRKNIENSSITVFLINQAYSLLIYLFFYLLSAFICLAIGIKESDIPLISVAVFCLSGFVCGFLSGFKIRKNGLVNGAISVLPSVSILILISCVMNAFRIEILILLLCFVLILVSGVIGGVTGVNIRIKPKKRGR